MPSVALGHVLHTVRIDVESVQLLAVGVDEDRCEQRERRRLLAMVGSVSVWRIFLRSSWRSRWRSLSSTASMSLSTMPVMRLDEEWK